MDVVSGIAAEASQSALSSTSSAVQIKVAKNQEDQKAQVTQTLIESATESVPRPGVGEKLNIKA